MAWGYYRERELEEAWYMVWSFTRISAGAYILAILFKIWWGGGVVALLLLAVSIFLCAGVFIEWNRYDNLLIEKKEDCDA